MRDVCAEATTDLNNDLKKRKEAFGGPRRNSGQRRLTNCCATRLGTVEVHK